MKILKSIWNGFNWLFGGGTKAHTNVIDTTKSMTMAKAKFMCDQGFKVRYCGWVDRTSFVEKDDNGLYYKHGVTYKNRYVHVYRWEKYGPDSIGSWEIA